MKQNNRAGLIPEEVLKDIFNDPYNMWRCEILVEIAGKHCSSFDNCAECIDYALDWYYGGASDEQ